MIDLKIIVFPKRRFTYNGKKKKKVIVVVKRPTSSTSTPADENEFRPLQLFAFVGIDENKKVVYSYYSKTIGDFPDVDGIIKKLI